MKIPILIILLLGIAHLFLAIRADLIIKNGAIKNENSGPIKFDTNNDGVQDITFTQDGKVGLGVTNPKHTFDIKGSFGMIPQTVSSDTTLSGNSLILADTSSAGFTLILPFAASLKGRFYEIKKIDDNNSLTIQASDLIGASNSVVLTTSSSGLPYLNIFSDGGKWCIRSQSIENTYSGTGNLIGWWKLNEISGNVVNDSSYQENHATSYNLGAGNTGIISPLLYAYKFDGIDDYIESQNQLASSFPFTMSGWIKSPSGTGAETIFSLTDNSIGTRLYGIGLNNGTPRVFSYNGTYKEKVHSSTVLDGNWHHVCGVFISDSEKSLYVNGVFSGNISGSSTYNTSINTFSIGRLSRQTPDGYATAQIDDVRFYNRALNSEEVLSLYSN